MHHQPEVSDVVCGAVEAELVSAPARSHEYASSMWASRRQQQLVINGQAASADFGSLPEDTPVAVLPVAPHPRPCLFG